MGGCGGVVEAWSGGFREALSRGTLTTLTADEMSRVERSLRFLTGLA